MLKGAERQFHGNRYFEKKLTLVEETGGPGENHRPVASD
jgi:hypothetical protein